MVKVPTKATSIASQSGMDLDFIYLEDNFLFVGPKNVFVFWSVESKDALYFLKTSNTYHHASGPML